MFEAAGGLADLTHQVFENAVDAFLEPDDLGDRHFGVFGRFVLLQSDLWYKCLTIF